jgi:ribosomal protein S1
MSAEANLTAPGSINDLTPGMEVQGTIKRIELYGAFVDIGVGQDGLLHISQLGRPNVHNVADVVQVGQVVPVYVLRVEKEAGRIALSLVKPPETPWEAISEGQAIKGKVVRIENFGVFVDIGAERPGMIHVSELANGYVNSPSDVVKVGDEVEARIIKINRKKHRIDLSLKAMEEPIVMPVEPEDEALPTAMELALRRAMEGGNKAPAAPSRSQADEARRAQQEKRAREREEIVQRTLNHSHRG